jgi:hypothetical protein
MGFHLSNIVHQNAKELGILESHEIHLVISGFEDEMSVFLHFLQGFPELHRMARARNQHSFGLKARHNYYHNKIRALVSIYFSPRCLDVCDAVSFRLPTSGNTMPSSSLARRSSSSS